MKNNKKKKEEKLASKRKSLVGSGDRSEKIRSYNYPQGRITDHRINLTLYKLEEVISGGNALNEVIDPLKEAEIEEKVKRFNMKISHLIEYKKLKNLLNNS